MRVDVSLFKAHALGLWSKSGGFVEDDILHQIAGLQRFRELQLEQLKDRLYSMIDLNPMIITDVERKLVVYMLDYGP